MKIVLGNIVDMAFAGELDVIVQGCNCFCRMENGLAKTIADRCPNAVNADNTTKAGDRTKLGTYTVGFQSTASGHQFAVVNGYIQFERRRTEGEDLVEYDALRTVLSGIKKEFAGFRIGLPLIGAGIACGNWAHTERIVLEELLGCDVTIVHFKEN